MTLKGQTMRVLLCVVVISLICDVCNGFECCDQSNQDLTESQPETTTAASPIQNRFIAISVRFDMEFDVQFLVKSSKEFRRLSLQILRVMKELLDKTAAKDNIDTLTLMDLSKGSVIVSLRVDYHLQRGEDDSVVTARLRAAFQNIVTYETFQGHRFYSDFLHMSSPVLVLNSTYYGPDHDTGTIGMSKESMEHHKEHGIGKAGLVIIGCGSAFLAIFAFVLFCKMRKPTKALNAENPKTIQDTVDKNKTPLGSHQWTSPSKNDP